MEMEICSAYISKYNSYRGKQINLLMIPCERSWHYVAVKKLSTLLIGITLRHNDDFYFLNCLHFFRSENKLKNRLTYSLQISNVNYMDILFDSTKNKHNLHLGEECMKKFCISLREHATDVSNFE